MLINNSISNFLLCNICRLKDGKQNSNWIFSNVKNEVDSDNFLNKITKNYRIFIIILWNLSNYHSAVALWWHGDMI